MRRRPTLALVTPAPPEQTGIADYSWRLAGALAATVDVDVVVADGTVAGRPDSAFGLIDVSTFLARDAATPYTHVVYCLGNSPFHTYMLEPMAQRRGAVLAHEARFTDLFWMHAQAPERGADWYRELLRGEYPHLTDAAFGPGSGIEEAVGSDVYLFGPIIDLATRVLTTSEFSAAVGRKERPERATDIHCVGFSYPTPVPAPRDVAEKAFRLGTVGRQNQTKGIARLLDALAIVSASCPDASFEAIGVIEEEFGDWICRRATELGIAARVEFTGWLDDAEYSHRIGRLDLAVQLRSSTNGEVSAAVADCLVRGIPTAVSTIGPLADYPDGVVARVPAGADAAGLAGIILELIHDPSRRQALAAAAVEYTSDQGFGRGAAALLAALV